MCSLSSNVFTWAIQGIPAWENHRPGVGSLPGKCLTGCCFQNHWWYYILSGLKRRGSPVGASRQPGEVCWSLRGAACTHIHNIHTDGKYEPTQPPPPHTRTNAYKPPTTSCIMNKYYQCDLWQKKGWCSNHKALTAMFIATVVVVRN